jgi:DNA-binding SARP family transcriptional activator
VGLTIKLLGDPAIFDAAGQIQPVRGHQAWALLARVCLARGPLDRRALAAELFPETADPLGALRWCLAALRSALNSSDSLKGDPIELALPPGTMVDVQQLDAPDFDIETVGPLLGGLDPRCSPEFSTWLLVERERLSSVVESRLRQETLRAIAVEDYPRAIRLAELGARCNPFDERAHVLLVKSLSLAGRYDAALEHVRATEVLFQEELGELPSAALQGAARRAVVAPPCDIVPSAFISSLLKAGAAALAAGAADAGIDCLRRAVSQAERVGDTHLQAQTMADLGTALVHSFRGYDEEGAVLLRQSIEMARKAGDGSIVARCYRELGYVEALAGRRPSADRYLNQALEAADRTDNLAGIHSVMGFNLVDWGRFDEGYAHYARALDYARTSGNYRAQAWALGIGGWGVMRAGRLDEAEAWIQECLGLMDGQSWLAFRPWPEAVLMELKLRQGKDPEALRPRLEEAYALSCQLGDPCWEAAVGRVMGLTYAATSEFGCASRWLIEARRRCLRHTDTFAALDVEILASQAEVSLLQNDPIQAEATARDWIARAAHTHMDDHVARAAAFIAGTRVNAS